MSNGSIPFGMQESTCKATSIDGSGPGWHCREDLIEQEHNMRRDRERILAEEKFRDAKKKVAEEREMALRLTQKNTAQLASDIRIIRKLLEKVVGVKLAKEKP